jgi:hypothetical protein
MRFIYEEHAALPGLAWLVEFRGGSDAARVLHGPWLETRDRFFCDGVWEGRFEDGELAASRLMMGAGGVTNGSEVVLATASHPFEALYAHRAGDRLRVSASLPFLLARAGVQLAIGYIPYQARFTRTFIGLRHHVDDLPLEGGDSLQIYRMRNLHIGPDLEMRVAAKPDAPRFADYASYRAFLVEGLERIIANAEDPGRRRRYRPIATISAGYDSVASAAVAAECGCREAVTFRSARREKASQSAADLEDSGARVAAALGMSVEEFERGAYRSEPGHPEAEFAAAGDLGQDLVMQAFEHHLPGRLLVTGMHGDGVWGLRRASGKPHPLRRDLVRRDAAGGSLGEFRSRVGFQHVPLPCFAATAFPDIHAISCSAEMRPWTLGTGYDRPIARRLAEEHGVPRALFGMRKNAVTVLLNSDDRIRTQLTSSSRDSFESFVAAHAHERSRVQMAIHETLFVLHRLLRIPILKANALLHRLRIPVRLRSPVPELFHHDPGMPSFLVHWSLALVMPRYALATPARRPDLLATPAAH